MPVDPTRLGPYRQNAVVIRITKDGALSKQRESRRPLTDPDDWSSAPLDRETPTLVTFESDDNVDLDFLLACAAIVPVDAVVTPATEPEPDPPTIVETPPKRGPRGAE